MLLIVLLIFIFQNFIKVSDNAPLRFSLMQSMKSQLCSKVPTMVLENLLGGAYNPRYMSVDKPRQEQSTETGSKRTVVSFIDDFYVDNTFSEVLDNRPAWAVRNLVTIAKENYGVLSSSRAKRATNYKQEWNCKSQIEWMDLGPDYFPRYLRSVECLSDKCWFGIYKCKPRSFTVRLLRRRQGFCSDEKANTNVVGAVGLPPDLKELWVWEERAVNFCCDCAR